MGFIFGKYGIYLEFADGSKGFFMGKHGDHLMVCNSFQNADKYMTMSGAESYFYNNDLESGRNASGYRLVSAKIYSDGKFFRMD